MSKTIKYIFSGLFVLISIFALHTIVNIESNVSALEGVTKPQAIATGDGGSSGGNVEATLSTRSTGYVAVTPENIQSVCPGCTYNAISGTITFPSVNTAHTNISGSVMTDVYPGSTVYVFGAIAQKNGSVNGRYYQAGQLITSISTDIADPAWRLPQYGGYARYSPYALDFEMVKALFNANKGTMTGDDIHNFLTGNLGAFVVGGNGSISLPFCNDATCSNFAWEIPDIPSVPQPPATAPIPDCGDGLNWGDTNAEVKVINLTTGTGWVSNDYVWARPGDTIKFSNSYCYAARAVRGGRYSSDMPYAEVEDNRFTVSASPSNLYYFGAHFASDTQAGITYTANTHDSNPLTAFTPTINYFDTTGSWKFQNYSPHNTADSMTAYNCQIYDFAPYFDLYGFQVPGSTTPCSAGILTGNGSGYDNVGGDITQSITYNRVTAWRIYKHKENHGICAGCNWNYTHSCGNGTTHANSLKNQPEYNALEVQNTNAGYPYKSLASALAGAGEWGLVEKFSGDNSFHGPDDPACDHGGVCAANAWIKDNPHAGEPIMGITGWSGTPYLSTPQIGVVGYQGPYIPAGCGDAKYEAGWAGDNWWRPTLDYSTDHQDLGQAGSTAGVHIPYNFMTSAESHITGKSNGIVYVGEDVSSTFSVNILPRVHAQVHPTESYATIVPAEIRAVEFIVREDTPVSAMGGSSNAGGADPCSYFAGYMIDPSDCPTVWSVGGPLNPEGRYSGQTYTGYADNRSVPDLDKYPVGSKYCVAVGISISDSHSQPDSTAPVSGMQNFSGWRISGASCRTIAKKPNFQVWNGGIYTNGSIAGAVSEKQLGIGLGNTYSPTNLFGSWAEYHVVAAGKVVRYISGAATGYNGYSTNSLGLPGGSSPGLSNCDATKMTVANSNCNSGVTGNSSIRNSSQDIILERVMSRYTDVSRTSETSNSGERLSNGARYVKKNGNFNISDFVSAITRAYSVDDTEDRICAIGANTSVALKRCEGQIDDASKQTTSNYASNTLIIHVSGTLTIDRNICDGNGTCNTQNSASGTGTIRLGSNNSQYFTSIYSLPQVLLIADGGVNIDPSVNQVDAWIITNGNLNTCTGFTVGSGTERQCKSTLIVNGPVFANSVSLNRTGGAYAGAGNFGTSDVLQKDVANGGSITPAEIFNLRMDTLYWAYSQAQRFSQANATYTRELAPRY